MKITTCFLFGILPALLGSACFNPANPVSAPARESGADIAADTAVFNDIDPFTVSVSVGGDGPSRSIAGLPRDKLKANTGVRNFAQLMVLDTASKKIMGFAEIHESTMITIDALPLGKTYAFFLLMGHWKGKMDGTQWVPDEPLPTLLNVGLTESILNTEGSTTINIVMYPLVVQTAFTSGGQTVEPEVVDGFPKPVSLSPGDWKVEWTIQRANAGTDGLDRLRAAQAIMEDTGYDLGLDRNGGRELKIRGLTYKKDGAPVSPQPAVTSISNGIDWALDSAYTGNIGDTGAVNFNVEYVPFNLTGADDWKIAYSGKPVETACADGIPAWIIRNGVNDAAPTGNTNFNNFGDTDKCPDANANGAVAFEVKSSYTAVTGVTLNPSTNKTIPLNGTLDLTADVTPNDATNKKLTWTINSAAVTIDKTETQSGQSVRITGVTNGGKATITVTTGEGGYTASRTITVGTAVTGVSLTGVSLLEAETKTLTPKFTPTSPTNKGVTWKSSNTSVVTVSSSGEVTGKSGAGGKTATITVTTDDGGYTGTCTVSVAAFVPVTDITGSLSGLGSGGDHAGANYHIYINCFYKPSITGITGAGGQTPTNRTVTWKTNDSNLAGYYDASSMGLHGYYAGKKFELTAVIENGKAIGVPFEKSFMVSIRSFLPTGFKMTVPQSMTFSPLTSQTVAAKIPVKRGSSYTLNGTPIWPSVSTASGKINNQSGWYMASGYTTEYTWNTTTETHTATGVTLVRYSNHLSIPSTAVVGKTFPINVDVSYGAGNGGNAQPVYTTFKFTFEVVE